MRLGLERSFALHEALGSPAAHFDCVHVAGTNGKGSVCAKISAGLQASGLSVGTFTSPHIATFRERIRVNGEIITEEEAEAILGRVMTVAGEATFFEIVTMMGLLYFAEKGVDIAVLETGMGGRLDATNIVTPLVSVITSVSLDHMQYLGETIELITQEKAGIIKPGVPVVIGPHVRRELILEKIQPPHLLHQVEGAYWSYDEENSAIARRALELLHIPAAAIVQGLKAIPACRFEEVICPRTGVRVILDVGHNPDGIERLFLRLTATYPEHPYRAVVGMSKEKEVAESFKIVMRHSPHLHLVAAASERGFPVEELLRELQLSGIDTRCCRAHSSIHEGLAHALEAAAKHKEIVVVCGSFFIMEAIRRELGFEDPRDFTDMNERL